MTKLGTGANPGTAGPDEEIDLESIEQLLVGITGGDWAVFDGGGTREVVSEALLAQRGTESVVCLVAHDRASARCDAMFIASAGDDARPRHRGERASARGLRREGFGPGSAA